MLNLTLEVNGALRNDKTAKVATARNLWAPAVNKHSGYGRWAYLELSDQWMRRTQYERC
jgi:type III restriction enzyme